MTSQVAITLLKSLKQSLDSYCELNEEVKTAFRMAIEALNCSEFPNNSDTISRQAAIDACKRVREYHAYDEIEELKALPSAKPEIVRCKDCAKREYCRTSTVWAVAPDDNWYCADAERRTNE